MAVSTHAEGEQDSAGPSEPRDEQGISEFVSHFGGLMAASGMPGLTGYVFALLLAQPDAELTAQQIGQALNVSPAAVSGRRSTWPTSDSPAGCGVPEVAAWCTP